MQTKQQFVSDLIAQLPQAANAIGTDKLSQWASGQIASIERDREFAIYQAEGLSQHLKNVILCYLNLPSVGYDSFDNEKQVEGDQYRGYVARAKATYDAEVAELSVLQASNASTAVIAIQQSTIASALANWQTWIKTYNNAIASKQII